MLGNDGLFVRAVMVFSIVIQMLPLQFTIRSQHHQFVRETRRFISLSEVILLRRERFIETPPRCCPR